MKHLVTAIYADHEHPPLVTVAEEGDLKDTIAATKETLLSVDDGAFLVFYEIEGESMEAVSQAVAAHALPERDWQREKNMATLYFWTVKFFNVSKVIATKDPAPLNADEIEATLAQLPRHPGWSKHTILCHSEDGVLVTLNPDSTIERTPFNA